VHLQAKEMGREKMRSMGRWAGLWVGLMKVCHGQALVRGEILEGRHKTGRERGLDIISGYKSTVRSESNWMVPCVGEQCDE
jgi:hypothetical protein